MNAPTEGDASATPAIGSFSRVRESQKSANDGVSRGCLHFLTFFVSFLGAGYLIQADFFQPWSSTIVVASYTAILWIFRGKLPLTGEVKDSAYYLGFSLNLIFLLFAFRAYGPQVASDANAVRYLIQSLSSAMLATVTGLICRYLLYSVDNDELVQKRVYAELEEEIRRSTTGLRQSQRALIGSISSFIENRRKLAEREEETHANYIAGVQGLLHSLQTMQKDEILAIQSSVKELQPATQRSVRQLSRINDEIKKLQDTLTAADLGKAFDSLGTSLSGVQSSADGMKEKLLAVSNAASSARSELAKIAEDAPTISKDIAAVDTILSDFIELIRKRVNDLH